MMENIDSIVEEATQEIGANRYQFPGTNFQNGQNDKCKRPDPMHGFLFQLNLLMLFLYRAISLKYSFRLGTEIKEASKFDDIVFAYRRGGETLFRLLQAKHRLDKTKNKVTEQSLLDETKGDFSLPMYFFSYMSCIKKRMFRGGTIKDVTICTNIEFSDDILRGSKIQIEKLENDDDILDIKMGSNVQPMRYRFNEQIIPLLKPRLVEYIQKSKITPPKYTENDIKSFLKCLVFAVNCPSEQELGSILKVEIGKDFDFITTENVYNQFFLKMMEWMQGKIKKTFLSYEEGKEFLDKALKGIPIWFNVRSPIGSFTGRAKELAKLHQLLQRDRKPEGLCIAGIGGVGKSELARKYIHEYHQDYDSKVVWFNADSYKALRDSFYRLASDELKINTKNVDGKEKMTRSVVQEVFNFFSSFKSIFIFDNAACYKSKEDETDGGLERFLLNLPPNSQKPYVLITSRNQKWPRKIEVLNLDVFQEDEAIEFVHKTLMAKTDDVKLLVAELQYFPLALQLATTYILDKSTKLRHVGSELTVKDYLGRLKIKTKELLDFNFPEDYDNYYSKTVFQTWNVSLEAIANKEYGSDALEVLNILSYMAPDNISTKMFLDLISDKEVLSSALDLLKQYSMITLENTTINIHRLVQQTTMIKLQELKMEVDFIKKAINLVNKNGLNVENINHAMVLWDNLKKHSELLTEFCWLSPKISLFLNQSGRYNESYSFGQSSQRYLMELKSSSTGVLKSLNCTRNNIGVALERLGKYDEALTIFSEVYHGCEKIYGLNDPLSLLIKSNIATILHSKGMIREALELYKEVLELRRTILGERHEHTLLTRGHIAKILFLNGNLTEASKTFRELSAILEATLGPRHHHTLNNKFSMAIITMQMGDYEGSLNMLQEVHDAQEIELEQHHPDLIHTKCCIAAMYVYQEKLDKALKMYKDISNSLKETLTEDHPDLLKTRRLIAKVYQEQGRFDKALRVAKDVYQKQEANTEQQPLDALDTLYLIAKLLYNLGKYDNALKEFQQVLKKRTDILTKDHRDILRVKNSIVDTYIELDQYDKALDECMKIVSIQKKGLDLSEIFDAKHNLGKILVGLSKFDAAIQIFCDVLDQMQKNEIFQNDQSIASIKLSLAEAESRRNNHSEAIKISEEILKEAQLKEGRIQLAHVKTIVGKIFIRGERKVEALGLLKEALEVLNQVLGSEHPQIHKLNRILNLKLK